VKLEEYETRDLLGRLLMIVGWVTLWTKLWVAPTTAWGLTWDHTKYIVERTAPLISLGYLICSKPPRRLKTWTRGIHKASAIAAALAAVTFAAAAALYRFEEVFHFNWRWAGPVAWATLYAAVAAKAPGDKAEAVHTAVVAVAAGAWLYEAPVAPWVYDGWGWLISAKRPLLLNEGLLCSVWAGATAQRCRRLWVVAAIYAAWSLIWIGLYAAGYASELRWWAVWIPRLPTAALLFAATTQEEAKNL